MKIRSYLDAREFLNTTRSVLESQDVLNNLMLGICGQLIHQPAIYKATPCLQTISDSAGLVFAAVMTPPHQWILSPHPGDFELGTTRLIEELLHDGWSVPGPGISALYLDTHSLSLLVVRLKSNAVYSYSSYIK